MSNNSAKQNLIQLKDWIAWRKANNESSFINSKAPKQKFSKAKYYKSKR